MLLIEEPLLNQRRAAFLAARIVGCNRHPEAGGSRGVSDPTSAAPLFAPGLVRLGSLTPRPLISFVRTNEPSHSSRHEAVTDPR